MSTNRKARIGKNQQAALTVRDTLVSIIGQRQAALIESGQFVAVEWAKIIKTIDGDAGKGFVNAVAALHGFVSLDTLVSVLPHHDKTKVHATQYVQAKTVQKIVNLVHALAGGTTDKLSAYTLQVLHAAMQNAGKLSLQGAQASLSRRVARPDHEVMTSRASYTTGTAGAQASQVRELLRLLGLAEVTKNKKNDTFVLHDAAVQRLSVLFAESLTGDEEQPAGDVPAADASVTGDALEAVGETLENAE